MHDLPHKAETGFPLIVDWRNGQSPLQGKTTTGGNASPNARNANRCGDGQPLTHVSLIWPEGKQEDWLRFGKPVASRIVDRRQRIESYAAGQVFALERWANDFADRITIDGIPVGVARARDGLARPLPIWMGCRTLHSSELFVMNPAAPDSFDGRYFGVLRFTHVIGRAKPVWTDETGDGRHRWFADPHFSNTSTNQEGE